MLLEMPENLPLAFNLLSEGYVILQFMGCNEMILREDETVFSKNQVNKKL